MLKQTALTLMLLVLSFQSIAFANTAKNVPITVGELFTLPSKVLEQERSFQVYLPASYHQSTQKYPVLYVLDGQKFFTNAVAIQQSLGSPDTLPEMIVVGIVNKRRIRRTLLGDEEEKFQQYLSDEVLPFIDSQYRTSQERILFGWEMGAYFASSYFFHEQQLFSGAIVSNGANVSDEKLRQFNKLNKTKNKYLYITNSIQDIYTIQGSEELSEQLSSQVNVNLNWKYQKFNNENHSSLAYVSMYEGLKYYFHNYDLLRFHSIEQFNNLGGLDYVKEYSAKRSKRFGLPEGISYRTKHNLMWLSMNKDNYEYFNKFRMEFNDLFTTGMYVKPYWLNKFGRFHLKHGNIKLAKEHFVKAVALATETSDENLAEYKSDLAELNKRLK
jgi:predicted alpha/beta superfamily hydrolase